MRLPARARSLDLRGSAHRALARHPRLAVAVSVALRRLGSERRATRAARDGQAVGRWVPVIVPQLGPRPAFTMLACDGRDQIARAIWYEGWLGFERPLPDLFTLVARRASGTLLDVGANTGFYGLLAARANPRLRVHCFEPFPPVYELLVANLARNALAGRIRAEAVALGAAPGRATLWVPLQDHGLVETSCSLDASFKPEHSEAIDVPVQTLDAYTAANGLDDVSVVKIDVEGFEPGVLAGAEETVRRSRPVIFYELLRHGDHAAIERFRTAHRYASYRLRTDRVVHEACVAFDDAAWNHVMVPEERVAIVHEGARVAGVPVEEPGTTDAPVATPAAE